MCNQHQQNSEKVGWDITGSLSSGALLYGLYPASTLHDIRICFIFCMCICFMLWSNSFTKASDPSSWWKSSWVVLTSWVVPAILSSDWGEHLTVVFVTQLCMIFLILKHHMVITSTVFCKGAKYSTLRVTLHKISEMHGIFVQRHSHWLLLPYGP